MRRIEYRRQGFTLLEMLLVLAVIAIFAAITMPSVMRIYGQEKLTSSAEGVRTAIASARTFAIESGLIYQFRTEVNGRRYVVVPFEPDHLHAKEGTQSGTGAAAPRTAHTMPQGISFSSAGMGSSGIVMTAQKLSIDSLDGLPNAGDLAGLNWSAPILFHPEGSANTDAEITVSDARAQDIKLHVRAFTGAVKMERLVARKHK